MKRPGARLPLLLVALAGCGGAPRPPPDVVLVVLDTLRADRVSCYGYPRETTPNLDALCARGLHFTEAWSTSSWTIPAHASLFTGLPPIRHGATQEHTRLEPGPATLAELLGAAGYTTFAVSANPLVGEHTGLDRGFDRFVEAWRGDVAPARAPGEHVNLAVVRRLLSELDPARPLFLFVNYIEPHGPYTPPEPYRSRFLRESEGERAAALARRSAARHYLHPDELSSGDFRILGDLYDGEVAHVDALLGQLVAELERSGRLENALLLVTSDHGENLGEHGHYRHVFSLHGSAVRVPLVAVLPGGARAGERREEAVSLRELFATILARAGASSPSPQADGRDLLAERAPSAEAPVFAEYYYPLQALGTFPAAEPRASLDRHLRRQRSVQDHGLRLLWSSDGRHELYDLTRDPGEQRDRSGEPAYAERELRLLALLADYVREGGGEAPLPEAGELPAVLAAPDAETRDLLRELGYLP